MNKYKTNYLLYISIVVGFVVLRLAAADISNYDLKTLICDFAISGLASAIVALLIDISQSKRKNIELKSLKISTFQATYISILTNEQVFAIACQICFKENRYSEQTHNYYEWLEIFKQEFERQENARKEEVLSFVVNQIKFAFEYSILEIDKILSSRYVLQTNYIIDDETFYKFQDLRGIYEICLTLIDSAGNTEDAISAIFVSYADIIKWIKEDRYISSFESIKYSPYGLYDQQVIARAFSKDFY